MITVATFSKPEEAQLLRLRLEAGGVPAYVQDENVVLLYWFYSNAIGGVRVQIAEEDIDAAKEILAERPVVADDPTMPRCPKCGSCRSIPDEIPRRIAFLSILLVGFPFLFYKRRWICKDCGHKWNAANTKPSHGMDPLSRDKQDRTNT